MKYQYPMLAAVLVATMSGCLTTQEPELLQVSVELDNDTVEQIQNLSGIVRITNTGTATVTASMNPCLGLSIERQLDAEEFRGGCGLQSDPPYPERSFAPGETWNKSFSFAGPDFFGEWDYYPEEFPRGKYGLSASPVRGGDQSEMVLFHTLEDAQSL